MEKNILKLNLTNLLANNLANNIRFAIDLNSNEVEYMKLIVKNHPDILNNITAEINEIVKDGKIDMNDIPHIVLLVSNLYNGIMLKKFTNIDIINIVHYTVECILYSEHIHINNFNKGVIEKAIDVSIRLLKYNVSNDKNSSCPSCIIC